MKTILYRLLPGFLILLLASGWALAEPGTTIQTDLDVNGHACYQHVRHLAGEEYEGRGTGSETYNKAAAYIADQMRDIGLVPLDPDSSYFQRFTLNRNFIIDPMSCTLQVYLPYSDGVDTLNVEYTPGEDFLPYSSSKSFSGPISVVFAGYGLDTPENNWNDYENLDVSGKFVLVLNGHPPFENMTFTRKHRTRGKLKMAQEKGAAGFISIGNPIGSISSKQGMPALTITKEVANDLLKGTGYTIGDLKQEIETQRESISLAIPNQLHLQLTNRYETDLETMNIVGMLPGSDPELRDEYILIGGHADHIGNMGSLTFWGANDNASGPATVLEIARVLAAQDTAPARSIVFMAFTGEEMGLKGAKYYAEHPMVPLENTRLMINLDMVGAGHKGIMIVGGKNYPELLEMYRTVSKATVDREIAERWTAANSDHWPFQEKNIPAVFLYAFDGPPTYHTINDKPETLDPVTMGTVGSLTARVVMQLAEQSDLDFQYVERNDAS